MAQHIVVGVEDNPGAAAALRWALTEADLRDASLEVVHVWLDNAGFDQREADATVARLIDEARRETGARVEPVVTIHNATTPRHALIKASESADLLVVGVRGHGSVIDRMLGSVSTACVHHAHCPVLVVRPTSGA